jgi:hypothetical protein
MSDKINEQFNESLKDVIAETMGRLREETDNLLKLIDAMIVSSEERNQVIKETLSELKKLIK